MKTTVLNLRILTLSFCIVLISATKMSAQNLSSAWEELTSAEFRYAVERSEGVCIVPMGVIEKHGQHLPLGTDVFTSRHTSLQAAGKEYAVVLPMPF